MNLIKRLNELFIADPGSGTLTRKVSSSNKPAGEIISAYSVKSKYRLVQVDQQLISLHRIIWMMSVGDIPKGYEIDHINGNPRDNRLGNLRVCTHAQNMLNKKLYSNNKSGIKGVYYDSSGSVSKPWRSQIRVYGKKITLGRYESAELARAAYLKASAIHHKEFSRKQ